MPKIFYTHYKYRGSEIFHGLLQVTAANEAEAIKKAEQNYIEHWRLSFPGDDAEAAAAQCEFLIYT